MKDASRSLVAWLQQNLPAPLQWMADLAGGTLDYLLGPILDQNGRFQWWGLVAAVAITAGVFAADRQRNSGRRMPALLQFCFPAAIWRHRSTWTDLKIGFFNAVVIGNALNLTWRFSTALLASAITYRLAAWFGPGPVAAGWGPVSIVLFTLAMSLANDLGYFLFHWASHLCPPLWAIHRLHHSAEVMSPLTAARVHPLERAILGPFRAVTTGLIAGPLFWMYAGETGVATVFGLELSGLLFNSLGHVLHHSHVWISFGPVIGRVIVSPAAHQIHHSSLPRHIDRNFAEHWAIWDTLFGTLYLPREREVLKLGLAGHHTQPHPGLLAAYVRPVTDSAAAVVVGLRGWLGRPAAQSKDQSNIGPSDST
jgi:sterol desaturase/sphingolipid hydroxylase (fatty acid hydroxylase superfamily)